jgi:hypothetical protein
MPSDSPKTTPKLSPTHLRLLLNSSKHILHSIHPDKMQTPTILLSLLLGLLAQRCSALSLDAANTNAFFYRRQVDDDTHLLPNTYRVTCNTTSNYGNKKAVEQAIKDLGRSKDACQNHGPMTVLHCSKKQACSGKSPRKTINISLVTNSASVKLPILQ